MIASFAFDTDNAVKVFDCDLVGVEVFVILFDFGDHEEDEALLLET